MDSTLLKNQVYSPRFDMAIQLLGTTQNKMILDLGCGEFGLLTRYLVTKNCKVIAVELNLKSIHKAKKNIHRYADNLHFINGNASSLPLAYKCVDVIFMLEVLEHIPLNEEVIALREIRRVLKNGGSLILSVPYNHLLVNLFDPHWLLGHRHYKPHDLKRKLIYVSFSIHDLFVVGGILNSISYILYLPWHLIWSHLIKSEKEPTFPLQRYIDKILYMEFTPRKIGNYLFCKAIKI